MIQGLLFFYLAALHSSIAGMEIFSAAIMLAVFARRDWTLLRQNRTLVYWLFALILGVLLSLWATPQEKGFWFQFGFMRWTIMLWGMAMALNTVWSEKFERRLLSVWGACLVIASLYGVLQCLTGFDFLHHDIYPQGGGIYKAVGFYSFSMSLAYAIGLSVLALSLPVLKSKPLWLGITTCCAGGLGILSAMSRGAWTAAVISVLIYVVFEKRKWILPAFVMVAAGAAGLTWWSVAFGQKILGMVHFQFDHSATVRFKIWQCYFNMFLDHPLFGIGLLEGDKLLPEYYARLGVAETFVSHAHNNFLQFLAGTGLFGFVSYCAVIFIMLRKAWRLRLSNFAWGWSLFLAQIFFHLGGLTEANFITAIVNHMLIFLWALILALEARAAHTL